MEIPDFNSYDFDGHLQKVFEIIDKNNIEESIKLIEDYCDFVNVNSNRTHLYLIHGNIEFIKVGSTPVIRNFSLNDIFIDRKLKNILY